MRIAGLAAVTLAVLAALPATAQSGGPTPSSPVTPVAGDVNSPVQSTSPKDQQALQDEEHQNAQAMRRLQTLDRHDKQKMKTQEDAATRSAIPDSNLNQQH